jgi:transcriptional regulator with XRE-family HTH domain
VEHSGKTTPSKRVAGSSSERKAGGELPAVGRRLRLQRRLRRLRLKDLAEKANCSESLLSRVENGLVVPSLTTLHRVSQALGVSVAALLEPVEERICTIYGPDNRPRVFDGAEGDGSVADSIIPMDENRRLEGLMMTLPGGGPLCGPFRHEGEEVGYVIEGEVELIVDGERFVVPSGSTFFFESDRTHSYRAAGRASARIVWINTPPTF